MKYCKIHKIKALNINVCACVRVLQALLLRQTWAQTPRAPLTGLVTLGMLCDTDTEIILSQGPEVRV